MAIITPDRFDPLKAYCNVRLQQGVPLVDADVNELDDIRKFEVRAFLKWFVGDGVPEGNDGFRIAPFTPQGSTTPASDDFTIAAGVPQAPDGTSKIDTGLGHVGRCIVDGLDVIIQSDTSFKAQPLHPSNEGAPQTAEKLGGPVISLADLTASGPVTLLVYLDVWERVVKPAEEPTLILSELNTESCARIKREWVVRTVMGTSVPASSNGHSYYGLAIIERRANQDGNPLPILQTDITDLRERGLMIAPSTLITDTLGGTASDYRRGLNRPQISLREAINALLKGEQPGTAESALTPEVNSNNYLSRAFVFDPRGGINALWTSDRNSGQQHIFAARCDPANPEAGFVLPAQPQVTSGPLARFMPHAAVFPTGDILAVYSANTEVANEGPAVFFKRATDVGSFGAATAVEQRISRPGAPESNLCPYVVFVPSVGGGGFVIFFYLTQLEGSTSWRWVYRRRQYQADWAEDTAIWADANGTPLPSPASDPSITGGFHAAATSDGKVWMVYETQATPTSSLISVQATRLTVADGALLTPPSLTPAGSTVSRNPFVAIDKSGLVWVFVASNTPNGIFLQQYKSATGELVGDLTPIPGTEPSAGNNSVAPTAVVDAKNGVWLFWRPSYSGISSMWWSPSTRAWGAVRPLPDSAGFWGSDYTIFATRSPAGAVWLFRQRDTESGHNNVFFRRLFDEI